VKPNLFGSYTIAKVSIEARYLFVGLFCEADDEGRMIDSPKRLAGSLFPHDDKVTEKRVNGWLEELAAIGSIYRYTAPQGGRYIVIPKWAAHQKVSHPLPSPLPSPDGEALATFLRRSGAAPEDGRNGSALNGKGN
jgi:hypothetical protein